MNKLLRKKWHWMIAAAVLPLCIAGVVSGKDTEAVDEAANIVQPTDKIKNAASNVTQLEEASLDLAKLKREEVNVASVDLFSNKSIFPAPTLPPPPEPPAPSAPPLPFTYMGKLVDGDVVILFLGRQNQDYNVKLNDVLDNTYRVEQISDDRVVFTYLPLEIQQTLNISRAN